VTVEANVWIRYATVPYSNTALPESLSECLAVSDSAIRIGGDVDGKKETQNYYKETQNYHKEKQNYQRGLKITTKRHKITTKRNKITKGDSKLLQRHTKIPKRSQITTKTHKITTKRQNYYKDTQNSHKETQNDDESMQNNCSGYAKSQKSTTKGIRMTGKAHETNATLKKQRYRDNSRCSEESDRTESQVALHNHPNGGRVFTVLHLVSQ